MHDIEARALCLIICGTDTNNLMNEVHSLIGRNMSKITCKATSSLVKELDLSPEITTKVISKTNKIKKQLRSRDTEIIRRLKKENKANEEANLTSDITMIVSHQDEQGVHLCTLKDNRQLTRPTFIASSTVLVESFDAVSVSVKENSYRIIKNLGHFCENEELLLAS